MKYTVIELVKALSYMNPNAEIELEGDDCEDGQWNGDVTESEGPDGRVYVLLHRYLPGRATAPPPP